MQNSSPSSPSPIPANTVVYVLLDFCLCVSVCVYTCLHTQTYIYLCTDTYIYICIHTHFCALYAHACFYKNVIIQYMIPMLEQVTKRGLGLPICETELRTPALGGC